MCSLRQVCLFALLLFALLCSLSSLHAGANGSVVLLDEGSDGTREARSSDLIVIIGPGASNPEENGVNRLGIVDVFTRLNVRSGPSTEYRIVGKL